MTDTFERLESNNKEVVENVKQTLREHFTKVNEPWLLNGLYEYFLNTNSERAMEILVNIKEPHHVYLFDRLSDSIKGQKPEVKVQALTLFGFIARSQPTWLYKIQEHILLKDLIKLLKNEVELLPLISALLVLIVLLPMLPSTMGGHLRDIFDIFSRLASWNCNPGKFVEDQLIHIQVALYALFLRLYGMYPCNFLGYLQLQYKEKNKPVFDHTVKPMLYTVRMHPSLVTASRETETTTERWKKMGVHDVIVECERFSLDLTDRCPHDSCQYTSGFRSRSGTTNSTIEISYQQNLKSLTSLQMSSTDTVSFFTPSRIFVQTPPITEMVPTDILQIQGVTTNFPSQEGTSPPEAAIEATPETTPVRDYQTISARSQPLNSNIARALTSFSYKNRTSVSLTATPTHSQPSSPMRKEILPFHFPSDVRSGPAFSNIRQESHSKQKILKLMLDRSQIAESSINSEVTKSKNLPTPSSPLRIINSETVTRQFISNQRIESPVSQEDEEILSIVSKNPSIKSIANELCMQDFENDDKVEEPEHGSPCTAGGLHMPNSKSMNNFAKRVQRLRHHSQCNPEPERMESSTGSSPGSGFPRNNSTVRRAISWPELRKRSSKNISKKEISKENKAVDCQAEDKTIKNVNTCSTQTENFWPYEHLFLSIFPTLELEVNDVKPSSTPSPAPLNYFPEKSYSPSIYDILDKYIEMAARSGDRGPQYLREQLQLVHQQLLFEKHRRETHAYRNRRLLSDAKSTRLLEECNSALRDTVQLQQRDLDDLRSQLRHFKIEKLDEEKKLKRTMLYWENQCKILQEECKLLKESNEILTKEISDAKTKNSTTDAQLLDIKADLLNTVAEVNITRQQAIEGEKGRKELEQVGKQLLLIGELQLKYQEKLDQLSAQRRVLEELEQLKETHKEEAKNLNQQLELKGANLDACRNRITELEHSILGKDDIILTQKQFLSSLNEQRFEKLEAVESKYQTQLTINRALEEKMIDLRQHLDLEKGKRAVHSPDTSSCHEVHVTTTAGFSPHSSPLSASLASSEGSTAVHEREMKNLQAIVDQRESTSRMKCDEPGDLYESEGQLTFSTKTD